MSERMQYVRGETDIRGRQRYPTLEALASKPYSEQVRRARRFLYDAVTHEDQDGGGFSMRVVIAVRLAAMVGGIRSDHDWWERLKAEAAATESLEVEE